MCGDPHGAEDSVDTVLIGEGVRFGSDDDKVGETVPATQAVCLTGKVMLQIVYVLQCSRPTTLYIQEQYTINLRDV